MSKPSSSEAVKPSSSAKSTGPMKLAPEANKAMRQQLDPKGKAAQQQQTPTKPKPQVLVRLLLFSWRCCLGCCWCCRACAL